MTKINALLVKFLIDLNNLCWYLEAGAVIGSIEYSGPSTFSIKETIRFAVVRLSMQAFKTSTLIDLEHEGLIVSLRQLPIEISPLLYHTTIHEICL